MAIKSGQLKEKTDYQAYILEMLRDENGYQVRPSDAFEPGYGMDTELLFTFLEATQKDALTRLEKLYKDKTRLTVLNYINNEINKKNRSLLDVLKHGVEFDNGVTLHLMYRKPATSFNPKAEALYQQNILSVMEEVYHKEGERIDLVIFLNGIAIFTFELKCNTSGQNYEDAIRQYKYDRDSKTRLLKFKAGCLAHFAMDLNEVYMCTNLKGMWLGISATTFFPLIDAVNAKCIASKMVVLPSLLLPTITLTLSEKSISKCLKHLKL